MRMDIRLPTPVRGLLLENPHPQEIILEGLSLSGAYLRPPVRVGEAILEIQLPELEDLKLSAQKVREDERGTAVRFLFAEEQSLLKLWNFILARLSPYWGKACPYCNRGVVVKGRCSTCRFLVDIKKSTYIYEHMAETLPLRVGQYARVLASGEALRVYTLLNRLTLCKQGYKPDIEFVGSCSRMLEVFSLIRKVAPLDVPVLILGESGTGKELVAQAIHERSLRRNNPFVAINCAAIPEALLEAELFGYEKGSFTGASASKMGKAELAHTGTLFLDEIGDLPLNLQAKLLRFLEKGEVQRIGEVRPRRVDVRILAATNRDLSRAVREGAFREDLYYRLAVFTLELPPLRERGEDKLILADYFLRKFSMEYHVKRRFSAAAKNAILEYEWPGNVREMINKIRRAIIVSESEEITPGDLGLGSNGPMEKQPTHPSRMKARDLDGEALYRLLSENDFNVSRTARKLGVSRPTLYKLIKKHGLKLER
ncbi:MAG TPA: sigma-54-dependent Fis family transcriptional regulator [Thermosulfurimonas dismutans]|uniref:Sigma-54-dependent Fis family transcriptional regulator n=1 Tax=Thermosulfurimonas dismutans TaxID=999894 RepID=A0A7C3CPG7_9BACT|nr:sigma-54-dependent Fis family transcriptional regulator [Thermosulfurimonas dismutans]